MPTGGLHSQRTLAWWGRGEDLAPPVLNRMLWTLQEPFRIHVAPVLVPSGKAAHLRTGTQEHNHLPAEIQHRYVAHEGIFIFLYIQL